MAVAGGRGGRARGGAAGGGGGGADGRDAQMRRRPRPRGRPRAAQASEAARREASSAEALSGIEARQAVLEDLVARREGTPAGARELMARSEGVPPAGRGRSRWRPGYERAVAAALGPLAQAVVLGAPDDLRLVLEGDDVLEAIVLDGRPPGGAGRRSRPRPAPGISGSSCRGPAEVIEHACVASCLPPPSWSDDVRLSLAHVAASRGRLPAGEPPR